MERVMHAPGAPDPVGFYAPATIVPAGHEIVVLSGQVALKEDGTFLHGTAAEQTTQIMRNVSAVLGECGCKLADIIGARIFYTQPEDFKPINEAYAESFLQEASEEGRDPMEVEPPSRTTVGVAFLPLPQALVEIEVQASRPVYT